MVTLLATLLALLLAAPLQAQDDCTVRHLALTALDHASLTAAVTASYRGIYGREPDGTGNGNVAYWVSLTDHYGAYGDNVCRAGWNRYMEMRLSGAPTADPALGDQPALYSPNAAPVVVNPPVVTPPAPAIDLSSVNAQLAAILSQEFGTQKAIADFRVEQQSEWAKVHSAWRDLGMFAAKYLSGPAAVVATCLVSHKCG